MLITIGIVIGIIIGIIQYKDYNDLFDGIGVGLLCAVILGVVGFLLSLFVSCCFTTTISDAEIITKPIYALQDNLTTSGSFATNIFYGSGYIDGELKYYYIEDTDIGKKIKYQAADKTYIHTIPEDENPSIEYHYAEYLIKNTAIKIACWPIAETSSRAEEYYVLNVPEKSITQDISIDLQ